MTKRDLHADLAICNAATAGLWALDYDWEERRYCVEAVDVPSWGGGVIVADCGQDADARFIAEARTGWPHAIERALAAEALLESHGPEGRNYTNREYVEMRARMLAAEAEIERVRGERDALNKALFELRGFWEHERVISRAHELLKEATADDQC